MRVQFLLDAILRNRWATMFPGPNHTLPTGGLARVRGGLSVMDFVKVITVQEYKPEGLRRLGPAAIALAEAEGLRGHAEAIRYAAS